MMEGPATHDNSTMSLADVTFSSIPKVDTSLYNLSSEEAVFFKAQTGIDDDEDLKKHILEIQAKAYEARDNSVTISTYPEYEHILKLGRERPDAVLLDIGCCFGVDARRAAADGFPAKNIIASDILNDFLELSHELFKTTPASYPGYHLPGDVFDPGFLSIAALSNDIPPAPAIDLSSLKSLNPLHGRISAINATRFFHLFTEDKQLHLAKALAGLLSAQPGSVICGNHVGNLEKGVVIAHILGSEHRLFSHSPQTWTSLWDGEVFEKGTVKVETELVEVAIQEVQFLVMRWSVMRL
ncbi:hypothetical protein DEU56DRAFT_751711 [Suillus clintonianus]|uniref:uncharacterized protein n=1 Tax=Suillus clintonianus TaxID=1904413 RepID=UPI001B87309A|nr:uncharacterized protein DEU56DRAFT_751711 [Suillus clintonianus]KAG2154063.1 hypothetical protein DEU56DRAFT_751711 [Suillus clintonianus]